MAVTTSCAACRAAGAMAWLLAGSMVAGFGDWGSATGADAAVGAGDTTASLTPKPASASTIAANRKVLQSLPFNDKQDFEDARRGLIDAPATLTIKSAKGNVVWDLESYRKYVGLDKVASDTVNPSLWRNAQLNMQYGLFKVTDRIYQVRGRSLERHVRARQQGLDRGRSADIGRDRQGGLRSRDEEPRPETGRRGHLQSFARRSLWRRARRPRRGRCQVGQGQDHRS